MKLFKKCVFFLSILIYLGLCALIIYLSFANGETSSAQSNIVAQIISESLSYLNIRIDPNSDAVKHLVRKIVGHFGLFLITGAFAISSVALYKKNRRQKLFLLVSFYIFGAFIAIITEVIQMSSVGRGPSANDTLINLSGYSIPFILYLIYFIYVYFKGKKEGNYIEL